MSHLFTDQPTGRLRRVRSGGGFVFSFNVNGGGIPLSDATFDRTGNATFVSLPPQVVFGYAAGDSLSAATFDRTGEATYTERV